MKKTINGEPLILLLVEDNAAHAEMVLRSFEQHQVNNIVMHVGDGQAALDYLHRDGEYTVDDSARTARSHGDHRTLGIHRAREARHRPGLSRPAAARGTWHNG